MERPVVHQEFLLRVPSVEATLDDLDVAQDLEDTLRAHRDICAGMAANMILERKRIICFYDEKRHHIITMLNPKITEKREPFEAEEGCLSLEGLRKTTRYRRIRVTWQDKDLTPHTAQFKGFIAEVIQHECDHLEGIVI